MVKNVMPKVNTVRQQFDKLTEAIRLADQAAASSDIATRLGALVLYAGMTDFLVIQAARLVEQIILKDQLAKQIPPAFVPHEDSFFYQRKVSTARILKGIRKLLPFSGTSGSPCAEAARATQLAKTMIDRGFAFLNHRDPLLHQIGNPWHTFADVMGMVDPAIAAFRAFCEAHAAFSVAAGPYRFSPKELKHFYGPESSNS